MPALVRAWDDDEATIIMVDSNLQREKILPSEKAFAYKTKLLETDAPVEAAIVDATECDIKRPKKTKKLLFRKKKRHTLKLQIIADAQTRNVICLSTATGRKHNFTLLKDSRVYFSNETEVLADKGYQGIANLHANSATPVEGSKNQKLPAEDCNSNASISRRRIYIEHINRYIKRFRILSFRYRNKRKKFGLRAFLICGIFNFHHAF